MATSDYGVGHPLAVKVWAKALFREALKQTQVSNFMGEDTNSLVYVKNDLNKSAGDKITYGLRTQLSGAGVVGDGTLEGNEEALALYSDSIVIDQLRNAVRSAGEMSDQRVPFTVREEAMLGLADWFAEKLDRSFFNQIAGNTAATTLQETGQQATVDATSLAGNTRIIYATNKAAGTISTTTASLSASVTECTFQLQDIDRLLTVAKTATPAIRPFMVDGKPKYAVFAHPDQLYNLVTDNATTRITWFDTMRSRIQGGDINMNPIFTGALGEYKGALLYESTRIPFTPGAGAANVRRAVLCGAQAVCFATGQRDQGTKMKWVEEKFDYENQLGVSAALIFGLKKTIFNSRDFATVVLETSTIGAQP